MCANVGVYVSVDWCPSKARRCYCAENGVKITKRELCVREQRMTTKVSSTKVMMTMMTTMYDDDTNGHLTTATRTHEFKSNKYIGHLNIGVTVSCTHTLISLHKFIHLLLFISLLLWAQKTFSRQHSQQMVVRRNHGAEWKENETIIYAHTAKKSNEKSKREYNVTLILYNYFFFFCVFETT